MKVRILGCGSSSGVPLVGNEWGNCDPKNPRNRRTRASILVESDDKTILIDSSPDLRQQLLDADISWIDAVLYTHIHADHSHGINDLALLSRRHHQKIDVYADEETLQALQKSFGYIFHTNDPAVKIYHHHMKPHLIQKNTPFQVGNVWIHPFDQDHGFSKSLGFRMEDFAYSTDVVALNDEAFDVLAGIKIWVVDCLGYTKHATHSHLDQTLEWIARVKPEKAYLTHMCHQMDYGTLMKMLPKNVEPAYDGLVLTF